MAIYAHIFMTQSQALAILKTGVNVFLTGEPGSGKTHTINQYAQYLREHGIEPAITASTGIAASHLSGMTIHSWCGIGIKERLTKSDLDAISGNDYIIKRVGMAKVLVIDEVSMLQPGTLNMVEAVCRAVRKNTQPFGGLQVIFVGDFFQLPPVVKRNADTPTLTLTLSLGGRGDNQVFAYESSAWQAASPTICYLSEQYRQDDAIFLNILSAIRRNEFNEEHGEHLLKRKTHIKAVPGHIPKLYSHNVDVDSVNTNMLGKVAGVQREFTMQKQGKSALVAAMIKSCLSPEVLQLKIGANVMFTKNSPKGDFVNGTLGEVDDFDEETLYPIIKTRSGKRIYSQPMDWTVEENGKIRGRLTQLPLRLAWAITVHKSQGMSLDAAVMDLSAVFEFGQGYVALSRVRRLSGLHLLGWNEMAFLVHPEILKQDAQFRLAAEVVEESLGNMPETELEEKHNDFIFKCGGTITSTPPRRKKEKIDTRLATLRLWQEGNTIGKIAEQRGLKEATIISHLERLKSKGKIKANEFSDLATPELKKALPKIHAVFRELDTMSLSAVLEKLGGQYSYDDLRVARLLLE